MEHQEYNDRLASLREEFRKDFHPCAPSTCLIISMSRIGLILDIRGRYMNPRMLLIMSCSIALLMVFSTLCNAQTTSGTAIIAIRTNSPAIVGHIGVGYQNSNGNYLCGAVEGKNNLNIAPGDDNGAWIKACQNIEEVKSAFRSRGYNSIKVISVDSPNQENAGSVIQNFVNRGYNLANNNCLTATDDVLRAYGVRDLPNPTTPNSYYNQISGTQYDL